MSLTLSIDLPPEVEQQIRDSTPDLTGLAREAFLVVLYRQGKLHHKQLAQLLSLDRWQTDDVLRRHQVTEDLPTPADLLQQFALARKLAQ